MNIGIVGCGNVSDVYLQNLKRFDAVSVRACADVDAERARAKAEHHAIARACTMDELVTDPEIQLVVNLTPPKTHFDIALKALEAGKHVYNEKPLALTRDEGRRLMDLAASKGLRVGGAPDTFMGSSLQTCRKVIDSGVIGVPVAASAFMLCHGHESWHPNPGFFYEAGGGPLFDMGPYYLTALVSLIGPIRRVAGSASSAFPERTVGTGEKQGQKIAVQTPTHIGALLEFAEGQAGTLTMSFDVWHHQLPCIEVYCTDGTLSVPDPNMFDGEVRVRASNGKTWRKIGSTHGYAENSRGLGVADMARAIDTGRPHRASGEMTFHVLDVMQSILEAAREGWHVDVASRCARPARMPQEMEFGQIDD